MPDVFLSHAEEDADLARQIVAGLRLGGIAVAPAHPAQQSAAVKAVARELKSAKCVLVLWTDHAVRKELILAEADYARRRDVLVSAVVGQPALPLGYRDVWYADLTGWTGDPVAETFLFLKRLIEVRLSPQRQAVPHAPHEHDDPPGSLHEDVSPTQISPLAKREPADPSTVFLCYRREDTQDAAGRLQDRLVDAYGLERVFMDIDSVPLGIDFVDHVAEQISRCSAVIVMIGRQWLKLKDKRRRRRLDNDDDLVRLEIAAALKQQVPVIPVLVQDVAMPEQDHLPDNIRALARRNGIALSASRWRTDVDRLIKELDRVMKPSSKSSGVW